MRIASDKRAFSLGTSTARGGRLVMYCQIRFRASAQDCASKRGLTNHPVILSLAKTFAHPYCRPYKEKNISVNACRSRSPKRDVVRPLRQRLTQMRHPKNKRGLPKLAWQASAKASHQRKQATIPVGGLPAFGLRQFHALIAISGRTLLGARL
eukprot:5457238-Amphidinium_carterae.7